MTENDLKRANHLKFQIDTLNGFLSTSVRCWKKITIKKTKRFEISTACGNLSDNIKISGELAERILNTIQEYKTELENELKDI